jgi:hypothetical protein
MIDFIAHVFGWCPDGMSHPHLMLLFPIAAGWFFGRIMPRVERWRERRTKR